MVQSSVFLSRLLNPDIGPVLYGAGPHSLSEAGPPWHLKFENGRSAILAGGREELKAAIELARDNDFTVAVRMDPANDTITDISVALVARVDRVEDVDDGQRVYFDGLNGPLVLRRTHPDFTRLSEEFFLAAKSGQTFAVSQSPRDQSIDLVAPASPPKHKGTSSITLQALPPPHLSTIERGEDQALFGLLTECSCPKETYRSARAPLCIPFMYPDSGCNARAHRMCHMLFRDRKVQAGKIWIFPKKTTRIFTKNAPTWYVDWDVHVACLIDVAGDRRVLDPALFDTSTSIDEWAEAIDAQAVTLLTADDVYTLKFAHTTGPFTIGKDPRGTRMLWELKMFTFMLTERVRLYNSAGPPFGQRQT